ncbi:MAG: DNA-binding response regulator [Marinobacter sp. 34-60-7]|nr:MAG: DNA-binding response regulator [Marinobacter sp. 34-60-7]
MNATTAITQARDSLATPPKDWLFDHVLLVDDHALLAQALARLMTGEQMARKVTQAATVEGALVHLHREPGVDLVLLDLNLSGASGLDLLPRLSALPHRSPPVVVVSSHDDELSIRSARAAGASGFLAKSAGPASLCRVLRAVKSGRCHFPGGVDAPPLGAGPLTPRQRDVLLLLAQGYPNKRICQRLNLTEHTVKSHLKAIFQQLAVHNRTECVSRARALGWLS